MNIILSDSILLITSIKQINVLSLILVYIEIPYPNQTTPNNTHTSHTSHIMQHLIHKTGLGMCIAHVIEELDLFAEKDRIHSMFIDVFSSRFDEFKKRHTSKFPSTSLFAYYIVQNQYPVGQNDIHQYFRSLAHDVKIGNMSLTIGSKEDRRTITIIEGYSRNESFKKRTAAKAIKVASNDYNWRQARMKQIGRNEPAKRSASSHWRDYQKMKKKLNAKKQ